MVFDKIELKKVKFRKASNTLSVSIPIDEYQKLPYYFYGSLIVDNIVEREREYQNRRLRKQDKINKVNILNEKEKRQLENIRKSIRNVRV